MPFVTRIPNKIIKVIITSITATSLAVIQVATWNLQHYLQAFEQLLKSIQGAWGNASWHVVILYIRVFGNWISRGLLHYRTEIALKENKDFSFVNDWLKRYSTEKMTIDIVEMCSWNEKFGTPKKERLCLCCRYYSLFFRWLVRIICWVIEYSLNMP